MSSPESANPGGEILTGFGAFTPEKILRVWEKLGIAPESPQTHEEAPGDPEVEPGAERS